MIHHDKQVRKVKRTSKQRTISLWTGQLISWGGRSRFIPSPVLPYFVCLIMSIIILIENIPSWNKKYAFACLGGSKLYTPVRPKFEMHWHVRTQGGFGWAES